MEGYAPMGSARWTFHTPAPDLGVTFPETAEGHRVRRAEMKQLAQVVLELAAAPELDAAVRVVVERLAQWTCASGARWGVRDGGSLRWRERWNPEHGWRPERRDHPLEDAIRYALGSPPVAEVELSTATPSLLEEHGPALRILEELLSSRQAVLNAHAHANGRLSRVLESITDAFFLLDPQWRFAYLNASAVRLIGGGLKREQLVGRIAWDLFPTAVGSTFHRNYHRAVREQIAIHFTDFYAPLSTWFEVRAFPGEDGLAVYFQDVSQRQAIEIQRAQLLEEQVEARRAVQNQQRWLEAVLNRMPTPLMMLEPGTGRITFSNAAASRMAGRIGSSEDGEREHLASAITDEQDVPLAADLTPSARAARGERLEGVEAVWHSDAGRFSLLTHSEPLPAMFGHPAVALLTAQDITPLKDTQKALQQAVASRDLFLSLASHELKTPVTAMKMQVQLARRRMADPQGLSPERVNTLVEQLDGSLTRLARLIDEMLDVSRIERGRLALWPGRVELRTLITETVARFSAQLEEAGIALSVDAPEEVCGEWDRYRLEQVLMNLISNAIQYAPRAPVGIGLRAGGAEAVLEVVDQGPGIPEPERERVFEKFERLSSDHPTRGLGLGLFIARQIARAHGGELSVTGTASGGARFVLRLPLQPGLVEVPSEPAAVAGAAKATELAVREVRIAT